MNRCWWHPLYHCLPSLLSWGVHCCYLVWLPFMAVLIQEALITTQGGITKVLLCLSPFHTWSSTCVQSSWRSFPCLRLSDGPVCVAFLASTSISSTSQHLFRPPVPERVRSSACNALACTWPISTHSLKLNSNVSSIPSDHCHSDRYLETAFVKGTSFITWLYKVTQSGMSVASLPSLWVTSLLN